MPPLFTAPPPFRNMPAAPTMGAPPMQMAQAPDWRRQMLMADMLMGQGASGPPVKHWAEGFGRLVQIAGGAYMANKAGKGEQAELDALERVMMERGTSLPAGVGLSSLPDGVRNQLISDALLGEASEFGFTEVGGRLYRTDPQTGEAKPLTEAEADLRSVGGALVKVYEDGRVAEVYRAPSEGGAPKAPSVAEFYGPDGRPYKAQWNGSEWVPVGGAKAPSAPGVGDVIGPIFQKLASGEPLTAGEVRAMEEYQRLNPVERMLNQSFADPAVGQAMAEAKAAPAVPGVPELGPGTAAPLAPAAPNAAPNLSEYAEPGEAPEQTAARLVQSAKAALAAGADPAEVERRMQALGLDPALLR